MTADASTKNCGTFQAIRWYLTAREEQGRSLKREGSRVHTQFGNKKMQVQEKRKGIWKRRKRLRSIMMVWQGGGVSFLAQGMGHGEREI